MKPDDKDKKVEQKPSFISNVDTVAIRGFILNFIVPIVCLGISLGLGVFVIYPSYTQTPALKQTIDSKTMLSNQLRQKLGILEKMIDFKSVVDSYVVLVNDALPSEPQVPQLLTQVDQIAHENGLNVTSVNYSFSEAAEGIITVSLGASGTYNQIIGFLSSLENASRLVDVDTLRYERDQNGSASVITFVLKSPYLSVKSDAVTDDPIDIDITSKPFVAMIDHLKALKLYKYAIDEVKFTEVETPSVAP